MTADFPIHPPTTKAEFRAAIRALVEGADANGVDPGNGGWGFRSNGVGWGIEVYRVVDEPEED